MLKLADLSSNQQNTFLTNFIKKYSHTPIPEAIKNILFNYFFTLPIKITNANYTNKNFTNWNLKNCIFININLSTTNFSGTNLEGAIFKNTVITPLTIFTNANLKNTQCDYQELFNKNWQTANNLIKTFNSQNLEYIQKIYAESKEEQKTTLLQIIISLACTPYKQDFIFFETIINTYQKYLLLKKDQPKTTNESLLHARIKPSMIMLKKTIMTPYTQ